MSETSEQPEVGSAMWGGANPFRRPPRLTTVPDEAEPADERVVSLADAAALVLLTVGAVLTPVGVALATSPGWGLAVFGVLTFALGVLIGGSR